ncbi:MAG: hypothetical protein F6K55_00810 [Moorea sp. SIO4A3]|nr:hypothetical protein [Moorena sp. SIO4A3]
MQQIADFDVSVAVVTVFNLGTLTKQGIGFVKQQNSTTGLRSQIITSSGFGSSQSSTFTSRDRNLWGAVLEGGFKPLAQDIVERNASATRRLQNLPKLWYMGAGSSVQIFVNTPFEL